VEGTHARSRNNGRPAGVAETFQVIEHTVEPKSDVASNVLKQQPIGAVRIEAGKQASNPRPEVPGVIRSRPASGVGKRLAGVSGRENPSVSTT